MSNLLVLLPESCVSQLSAYLHIWELPVKIWARVLLWSMLHSPFLDLTLMGSFLWGYPHNIIYQEKIVGLHILRHWTSEVITTVTTVVLVNTWCKIEYSFDMWRAANGAHAETYYGKRKNTHLFCATEFWDHFFCTIIIFSYMIFIFASHLSQTHITLSLPFHTSFNQSSISSFIHQPHNLTHDY